MTRNRLSIILAVVFLAASATSFACTNFLVGRKASTDGSTMISYSADSYWLYGALYFYPRANYKDGEKLKIYEWDTGEYRGEIDQVKHTYQVVGNMNEHQLSIGETTFTGRKELQNKEGIMDYGSLIYVTLQRAKTAREAIKVMTDLVERYGYGSTGESFSIADPSEVWIMEMIGKGSGKKGAVWVAVRIPDDCVSAHANQARITQIPFKDKNNCMYSKDVVSFARAQGYYNGKDEDFSFSDTYNPLDYEGLRFCEARVWSFFRMMNPEMNKYFSYINGETVQRMPLYIKPSKQVSVEDIKVCMRDHYEGTPIDMTVGAGSGPFGSPFRSSPLTYKVDGVEYFHERPIATQQTGFTFVAQMRSWLPDPIGGILWFGVDDASMGMYVPLYCGINAVPKCFDEKTGNMFNFSWNSAFWVNNWVASMVYNRYSELMPELKEQQKKWDDFFTESVKRTDATAVDMYRKSTTAVTSMLTDYSVSQAENVTEAWRKMGERFMVKYLDGVVKGTDEKGNFLQNDKHIPQKVTRPGYPEWYNRKEFVQPDKDRFRIRSQEEMNNRK
ncbi:MAG: dipeptidase [Bacteroidetes bacterium]|nr:MAG: dipeptidase [Bacteroidota bacterium]